MRSRRLPGERARWRRPRSPERSTKTWRDRRRARRAPPSPSLPHERPAVVRRSTRRTSQISVAVSAQAIRAREGKGGERCQAECGHDAEVEARGHQHVHGSRLLKLGAQPGGSAVARAPEFARDDRGLWFAEALAQTIARPFVRARQPRARVERASRRGGENRRGLQARVEPALALDIAFARLAGVASLVEGFEPSAQQQARAGRRRRTANLRQRAQPPSSARVIRSSRRPASRERRALRHTVRCARARCRVRRPRAVSHRACPLRARGAIWHAKPPRSRRARRRRTDRVRPHPGSRADECRNRAEARTAFPARAQPNRAGARRETSGSFCDEGRSRLVKGRGNRARRKGRCAFSLPAAPDLSDPTSSRRT